MERFAYALQPFQNLKTFSDSNFPYSSKKSVSKFQLLARYFVAFHRCIILLPVTGSETQIDFTVFTSTALCCFKVIYKFCSIVKKKKVHKFKKETSGKACDIRFLENNIFNLPLDIEQIIADFSSASGT